MLSASTSAPHNGGHRRGGGKVPHDVAQVGRVRKAEPMLRAVTRTLAYVRTNPSNPQPNIICAVITLETNPGLDKLRELVRARFLLMPRFRSKLVTKPGAARFEEVEYDESYHFEVHATETKLTRDDLKAFVSTCLEREMLADKPLWRVIIVPEMAEDATCKLIFLCDHALGDGTSLVNALLYRLADQEEKPAAEAAAVPHKPSAKTKHSLATRIRVGAYGVYQGQTQAFWRQDGPSPLKMQGDSSGTKLVASCREKIDLARIKQLARAMGPTFTVNDVLMAVFSQTLADYLHTVEDESVTRKRKLRALFPISLRPPGPEHRFNAHGDVMNKWAFGIFYVPLKKAGKNKELLHGVKKQLDEAKISPACLISYKTAGRLIPVTPRNVFVNLVSKASNLGTVTFSNVKGPERSIFMGGVEIKEIEFFMHSIMGVYFGIFSMNGKVACSVSCDASIGVDPQVLADQFLPSFDEMYKEICLNGKEKAAEVDAQ